VTVWSKSWARDLRQPLASVAWCLRTGNYQWPVHSDHQKYFTWAGPPRPCHLVALNGCCKHSERQRWAAEQLFAHVSAAAALSDMCQAGCRRRGNAADDGNFFNRSTTTTVHYHQYSESPSANQDVTKITILGTKQDVRILSIKIIYLILVQF
jgi:hypothetical protein